MNLLLAGLLSCALAPTGAGQRAYYGAYVGKVKIGYWWVDPKVSVTLNGHAALRYDSGSSTTALSDGQKDIRSQLTSDWFGKDGTWLKEVFRETSNGHEVTYTCLPGKSSVELSVRGNGHTVRRTIAKPKGRVQPNLELMFAKHQSLPRDGIEYWNFIADESRFVRTRLKEIGHRRLTVLGREQDTTVLESVQDGVSSKLFVDHLERTVRSEYAMNGLIVREPKSQALTLSRHNLDTVELRSLVSIPTDKPIADPIHLTHLKIRISGEGLVDLPSDSGQTVLQDVNGWIVDTHPRELSASPNISRKKAASTQHQWMTVSEAFSDTQPQRVLHMLLGTGYSAKETIAAFLNLWIGPDAQLTIPALVRTEKDFDAMSPQQDQVFTELCVNMIRMAGVPARVVGGYVAFRNRFVHHLWVEAWDGRSWIGIDLVMGSAQLGANHLKLSTNDNDHPGPMFFDPDRVKIQVLEASH